MDHWKLDEKSPAYLVQIFSLLCWITGKYKKGFNWIISVFSSVTMQSYLIHILVKKTRFEVGSIILITIKPYTSAL